ncbi:recombinase family protein [Sporosarcina sp. P17b]|uniref:recombinase family protein n=1 Tax=Sporosarcina sp. P17b TaxID=2048260 RepID=UPI00117BACDA|nr:recombinase family protein [Sporosarcina sp. P17b]
MIADKTVRVFLYIRVSTQEQAREGYSIGAQEERLRAYAKAKGYTVVKVYIDPGLTGSNLERPALQEMIRQIDQGSVDLVLVYKLDRLSRSQKDTLFLIEEVFLKNHVDFVSMNESFDTSTPFGRAMIGILSVFAQLEREQIRERSMMGKEARAKEGKWHGGGGVERLATGYSYSEGALTVNEYEAELVRTVFADYNKGHGANKIFRKVANQYPGVIASETSIRNILRNLLYIGKIKYKEEIFEGLHEPIVDEKVFHRTQDLLKKRTVTAVPFRKSYVFSGLLYCGLCGARMFGRSGGRLKNGNSMRYYVCYSRQGNRDHMITDRDCKKKSERKEKLEEAIFVELRKVNMRFVEGRRADDAGEASRALVLEKEIASVEKQIAKLVDLYSLDSIPLDIMSEKMESLKSKRDSIRRHLSELQVEEAVESDEDLKEIISSLSAFDWDNEEIEKKRLIAAKLINKISVYEDRIDIEWAF